MKTVKYILSCIANCFDALVGKGMSGGSKEGFVGLCSILIMILAFFAIFFILEKKTNIRYGVNVLCSLAGTFLFVIFVFTILIFFEKVLF